MAARFWVGGTGTWDASTTTHWAASSGGVGGATAPTTSDDVTFDTLSNATAYTVTMTGSPACKNLTVGAPLAGKVTMAGSGIPNIKGNIDLNGGSAGITWTFNNQINWSPASAITVTMKTYGLTISAIIVFPQDGINNTYQLLDNFTMTGSGTAFTMQNSGTGKTFDTNGFNMTVDQIKMGGMNIILGASTVTGASIIDFSGSGTMSAGTSTVTYNGFNSAGFNGGGKTYNIVNINPVATQSSIFLGNNSMATLTITGPAGISQVKIGSNTVSGTLTIAGNSSTNRLSIGSSVLGTRSTLTAATVTVTNSDFYDIVGSGAGNWDLTAVTGSPVNYGNCSGITFNTTLVVTGQIGRTAIGASTDNGNNGNAILTPFFVDSVGGALTNMKVCSWSTSGTSALKMAIYKNSTTTGLPTTRVYTSGAITVTRTTKPTIDSEWVTINITGCGVTPNQWYWLAVDFNNNDVQIAYDASTVNVSNLAIAYATFPQDPFSGTPAMYGRSPSIYALYTPIPPKTVKMISQAVNRASRY